MYARVAAFENVDTGGFDDLIETISERARAGDAMPDAKRVLILLDRAGARSLGITFFKTEEAIRQAEPVFERMGDEIPEEKRGTRTSVDVYEIAIKDIAEGAHAARVSTLEGAPEGIDEGIAFIKEQIVPAAHDISGWRGIIALVDRATGRTKTITLWDSVETLAASEDRADELRSEAAAALNEQIVGVDRYEVALSLSLAPAAV